MNSIYNYHFLSLREKMLKNRQKVKGSSFISAYAEPLAGLVALPQHCALCDVNNNGEYKLVIGHLGDGKRSRVFALFFKGRPKK